MDRKEHFAMRLVTTMRPEGRLSENIVHFEKKRLEMW